MLQVFKRKKEMGKKNTDMPAESRTISRAPNQLQTEVLPGKGEVGRWFEGVPAKP